jgi:anti-sigma regulatory factor (Ser/Thr protein kinase)
MMPHRRKPKVPQARSAYPLPNRPESASRARAWVRITLAVHGREDALDPAELIITELAANAAIHATQSGTIKIICEPDTDFLILGVIDYDQRQPVLLNVSEEDERGRGLMLVDALCDTWGCRPCDGGKLVFALLPLSPQPAARPPAPSHACV